MPFKIIITAANTVSRASAVVEGPPESISETISATINDGDRHSQHQRAVRLAQPVGNHLSMVHRSQHAGQHAKR